MASIHIRHAHPLSDQKAKKAVSDIARKLSEQLSVETEWEGDTLHFRRAGIDGKISLLPGEVEVFAKLGMFFSPMKSTVEKEIQKVLKDKF